MSCLHFSPSFFAAIFFFLSKTWKVGNSELFSSWPHTHTHIHTPTRNKGYKKKTFFWNPAILRAPLLFLFASFIRHLIFSPRFSRTPHKQPNAPPPFVAELLAVNAQITFFFFILLSFFLFYCLHLVRFVAHSSSSSSSESPYSNEGTGNGKRKSSLLRPFASLQLLANFLPSVLLCFFLLLPFVKR